MLLHIERHPGLQSSYAYNPRIRPRGSMFCKNGTKLRITGRWAYQAGLAPQIYSYHLNPQSEEGQATLTHTDFRARGGILMMRRFISPFSTNIK